MSIPGKYILVPRGQSAAFGRRPMPLDRRLFSYLMQRLLRQSMRSASSSPSRMQSRSLPRQRSRSSKDRRSFPSQRHQNACPSCSCSARCRYPQEAFDGDGVDTAAPHESAAAVRISSYPAISPFQVRSSRQTPQCFGRGGWRTGPVSDCR